MVRALRREELREGCPGAEVSLGVCAPRNLGVIGTSEMASPKVTERSPNSSRNWLRREGGREGGEEDGSCVRLEVIPWQEGSVITAERSYHPQDLLRRSPEAEDRDLRSKLGLESVCAPLCGS